MFDFLAKKFSDILEKFTGGSVLTEQNITQVLESVREALLDADVPYELARKFTDTVAAEAVGKKVLAGVKPGEQFVKIVYDQLVVFMGGNDSLNFSFQIPSVIMVMGLQGSGKTTSIAKMARFVQKDAQKKGKKRRILMASVDFYRPAAVDQLGTLSKSINVAFFRAASSHPVEAVREIVDYYKKGGYELLFLDTAGRLHIDAAMLEELENIDAIVKPRYRILVLDSMIGQESLMVAKTFYERIKFNGAMLTKLDSDTRGGVAFAFRYAVGKPVIFVGTGERADDIELFKADRLAGRILGMGDVLSLVEKAEEHVKEQEKLALEKSLRKGTLTLEDFAAQMSMVQSMGSLTQLVKYLPGIGSLEMKPEMLEKAEHEMKRFRAIINSMTPKERLYPKIIDGERKRRIAKGAGVDVADVNLLLQRFEESKQYVKLFKKLGRF
jgi:signal recognition particle subunit SRP54